MTRIGGAPATAARRWPTGGERCFRGGSGGKAGGGAGEESGGGAGSKEEFIAEADAICEEASKELGREFDERISAPEASKEGQAKVYEGIVTEVMVPQLEEQIREIRALDSPPGAEKAANSVIADFEKFLEAAESDPERFDAFAAQLAPKSQERSERLGFSSCGGYLG